MLLLQRRDVRPQDAPPQGLRHLQRAQRDLGQFDGAFNADAGALFVPSGESTGASVTAVATLRTPARLESCATAESTRA